MIYMNLQWNVNNSIQCFLISVLGLELSKHNNSLYLTVELTMGHLLYTDGTLGTSIYYIYTLYANYQGCTFRYLSEEYP